MKLYSYIGPPEIAQRAKQAPGGTLIATSDALQAWLATIKPEGPDASHLVATFVIDAAGNLRLAHRRSEHVACAVGEPVRAAGEMTFACDRGKIELTAVSNHSTGYVPEPCSLAAVTQTIAALGLNVPPQFTPELTFRRCTRCDSIQIVKDDEWNCLLCRDELPRDWNFDR